MTHTDIPDPLLEKFEELEREVRQPALFLAK